MNGLFQAIEVEKDFGELGQFILYFYDFPLQLADWSALLFLHHQHCEDLSFNFNFCLTNQIQFGLIQTSFC